MAADGCFEYTGGGLPGVGRGCMFHVKQGAQ